MPSSSSGYNALYVDGRRRRHHGAERAGQRETTWWPQFRIIDTATVTPDPEVAAVVAKFEAAFAREMDVVIATTAVELDSRNATVRTGEAAIGNLIADAMRDAARADAAIMNGGGIRAGKVYPAGIDHHAARRAGRAAVQQQSGDGGDVRRRPAGRPWRTGSRKCPTPAAGSRRCRASSWRPTSARPPGNRITAMKVGGAPLDEARTYKVVTNDFIARGGDGYVTLRDARRILPDENSPLLANQVMDYLRQIGTVRTGVEGRIVLR